MTVKAGRNPGATRTRLGASVSLFACMIAAALLLQAGVASASSRGFRLRNDSSRTLMLESVNHVAHVLCVGNSQSTHCVPTYYNMKFEGRPANGAVLKPGGTPHAWELSYEFDLFGLTTIRYAATLTYKIEGTDAKVEYLIATTPATNDSGCKVIPASAGSCTAGGLQLAFSNS